MNANGPGGYRRRRRGQGASGWTPPGAQTTVDNAALARGGFGEQKRALIETALLIALTEESGHGYTLIERVQELVGSQVYVDAGSVYRILRLLEEAGMVSSSWQDGVAGPQRRTYAVERSGRDLLGSWAGVLADKGNALVDLAKLARERLAP